MDSKRVLIFAVLSATITTALILALVLPLMGRVMAQPQAGTPTQVGYQGYLTDGSGNPLDGAVDLRFGIYAADSGGSPLWQEDHTSVQLSDGYFTVLLGEHTALGAGVFNATECWLQVTIVEGSTYTELPRQRISAVPFALQAANADTLDGLDSTELSGLTVYTDSSQWPLLLSGPKSVGNYNFPLSDYGIPSDAKAVLVELLCQWPTSIGVCYIKLTQGGATTLNVNQEDVVATALVPVVDGILHVNIANATNETHLYIFGYMR